MDSQSITRQTKRRGFNLIESAIVLGVVGAVIGGIWWAASAVNESWKINKTVEGIFTIARNIQNLISIRDAETIGNAAQIDFKLIDAGVFPSDWIQSGNIINSIGSTVTVYNLTPPNSTRFFIRFTGMDKSSCVKLAMNVSSFGAMAGSNGLGSYGRPSLGYIGFIVSGAPTYLYNFPLTLSAVDVACVGVTEMEFGFGYTRIN